MFQPTSKVLKIVLKAGVIVGGLPPEEGVPIHVVVPPDPDDDRTKWIVHHLLDLMAPEIRVHGLVGNSGGIRLTVRAKPSDVEIYEDKAWATSRLPKGHPLRKQIGLLRSIFATGDEEISAAHARLPGYREMKRESSKQDVFGVPARVFIPSAEETAGFPEAPDPQSASSP